MKTYTDLRVVNRDWIPGEVDLVWLASEPLV